MVQPTTGRKEQQRSFCLTGRERTVKKVGRAKKPERERVEE
jgi:hypothetical protein